jgi:hypothetical protein
MLNCCLRKASGREQVARYCVLLEGVVLLAADGTLKRNQRFCLRGLPDGPTAVAKPNCGIAEAQRQNFAGIETTNARSRQLLSKVVSVGAVTLRNGRTLAYDGDRRADKET